MPDNSNQEDFNVADALNTKIHYGAPDGPRKKHQENYRGNEPLEYPGHEAVAQYLVTPKSLRAFKSDNDLAKHFDVTRMTIYRWKQDPDVMKRVYWLSGCNRLAGDSLARINWPRIMQKVVEKAMKGDMQAIKFCDEIAWRQEKLKDKSQLSPWSDDELAEMDERENEKNWEKNTPSWCEQLKRRMAEEGDVAEEDYLLKESEDKPE